MNWWRLLRSRISVRLMLTGVISLFGMALLVFMAAQVIRDRMLDERIVKVRNLAEIGRQIIAYHHARAPVVGEAEAKAAALEELRGLRYQNGEYFFVYMQDGTNLLLPIIPEREGWNYFNIQDDQGVHFVQDLIANAMTGGAPVLYRFAKPGSGPAETSGGSADKIGVALPFAPWGWVVGTGTYLDDLDAEFLRGVVKLGIYPVLITLLSVAAVLALARSVSNPLRRLTNVIERLSHQDFAVQVPYIERSDEIGAIARAMAVFKANGMAFSFLQDRERARHAEIVQAHQRLSLQIRRMPAGYMIWEGPGITLTEWNPAAEKIFGWTAEEVVGRSTLDLLVRPDRRMETLRRLQSVIGQEAGDVHWIAENLTKDGRSIVCEWYHSPLRDGSGAVVGGLSMVQDITARRVAEERLRESEQRLTVITDNAPANIWLIDGEGRISYANHAMHGHPRDALLGTLATDWVAEEDRARMREVVARVFATGEVVQCECRGAAGQDGEWYSIHLAPIFEGRDVVAAVVIGGDISDRKAAEEKAEFLAYHDALTGLPNRALGKLRFDLALAQADRTGTMAALLLLDLDNFKRVNDSLGHGAGDDLLKAVAQRLLECVRGTDLVVRQGGDEFLILLTNIRNTDDVASVAAKILEQLQPQFEVDRQSLSTSASIGAVLYPSDGDSFDELLKKASTAVAVAKEAGRNTCRFFTEQMNAPSGEYMRIRTGLQAALENREFVLHYQPQFDLENGGLVGAEALIRWQHPELGLLAPGHFITVAEDSGLIVPIGEWVLHEACRQAVAWQQAGLVPITVAVNLSAVQFKRGDLIDVVTRALRETGLEPEHLELEITESALVRNSVAVMKTVERLRDLGIAFSIDDFGTGYSSLAYLKQFRIDKLKIDQSFVREMIDSPSDAAIVRTIVEMARSLGLRTIAEGIENETVLERLRRAGCDEAQGYYLGRPADAASFALLLRQTTAVRNAVVD